MNLIRVAAIASAIALLAGVASAKACEGKNVLFEDQFTELAPTWDADPNDAKLDNGKLVVSVKPDWLIAVANTFQVYDDIDFCVDVTPTKDTSDAANSEGGVVFWFLDYSNFYTFEIDGQGEASVWRKQRGKWLKQVPWMKAPGLKSGTDATNTLRVVTVGNQATFYANGQKFQSLKGTPPEVQQIGILVGSPKKSGAGFSFSNLKVTEPEKSG